MASRPFFALVLLLSAGAACGGATDPQQPVVLPYDDAGDAGTSTGIECVAGELPCEDICTNLQSDDHHCGTCGNACTSAQHCSIGACVAGGGGGRDGGGGGFHDGG
jgi:Stigma-specific protein, Stig1